MISAHLFYSRRNYNEAKKKSKNAPESLSSASSTDIKVALENSPRNKRRKRLNTVIAIMRTPEYKYWSVSQWLRNPTVSDDLLRTCGAMLDPSDLSVGKRRWETGIQTWRKALKDLQALEL